MLESYRLGLKFLPPTVNEPGPQFTAQSETVRVPLTRTKGLTERTIKRLLAERARGALVSPADFHRRVATLPDELETLIRAGGFDAFGQSRTRQFWEAQRLAKVQSAVPKTETADGPVEFDFRRAENRSSS